MSRFKKALHTLRSSRPEAEAGEVSVVIESNGAELRPSANLEITKIVDSTIPSKLSEAATDRIAIRKRLKIDRDDLVRCGLFPNAEQETIIQRQFREAKRPLVQNAFDVASSARGNENVIMVASDLPGAGKSFCALNLAESISMERDVGVILVDADVIKPGISRALGLQDEPGLIDCVMDDSVGLEDVMIQTNLNGLIVLPSGRRHHQATELLASRRMRGLVSTLSGKFSNYAVIFDTPPLLLTSEAQVLAKVVGQIVFVIEARASSQESVIRALELLDRSKPINAIFNKSRGADSAGYGSRQYAYPYWSETEDQSD